MVKDRVCGMEIETEKAAAHMKYEGKTYYFCSMSCRDKFNTSPQAYAKKQLSDHTRGGHGGCC